MYVARLMPEPPRYHQLPAHGVFMCAMSAGWLRKNPRRNQNKEVWWPKIMFKTKLVGGFNLPLWKMMELKSVGVMKCPIWWESQKKIHGSKPPSSKPLNQLNQVLTIPMVSVITNTPLCMVENNQHLLTRNQITYMYIYIYTVYTIYHPKYGWKTRTHVCFLFQHVKPI